MPKISIIMPVYNIEKYIDTSINSILQQSLSDFELVIIDDGSTDHSGEICDSFADKDGRVRVVHKRNEGVSKARNVGMDLAFGEYIGFVDSDDFIFETMFETLVQTAEELECDVVSSQYYKFYNDNIHEKSLQSLGILPYNQKLERPEILRDVIPCVYAGLDCALWNKVIRRDFIQKHGIRFDESLYIGEDYLFGLQCVLNAESYCCLDYAGYFYRIDRKNSAMMQIRNDYFNNYVRLYHIKSDWMKKFLQTSRECDINNKLWFCRYALETVNAITGKNSSYPLMSRAFKARQVIRHPDVKQAVRYLYAVLPEEGKKEIFYGKYNKMTLIWLFARSVVKQIAK